MQHVCVYVRGGLSSAYALPQQGSAKQTRLRPRPGRAMLSLLALLPGLPAPPTDSWFEAYKTFDEIVTFMDNTDFTSRNVAGRSHEGREVLPPHVALPSRRKLTAPRTSSQVLVYQYGDPTKPGLLVLCTVHAREWISAMACPWVAQQLAGDDTAILETNAVYIMPVVNPDGYAFSHAPEGNRYFRTNRRPGSYFGVDLNRNFPRHWNSCSQWRRCSSGNVGSSSQTYRGPSPGSEPETRAVMAVADEIEATSGLVLFVDVHSYSAVVSGRYDDATADISPISAQQNVAGPKIVDAMNSIDGYGTTHCAGAAPPAELEPSLTPKLPCKQATSIGRPLTGPIRRTVLPAKLRQEQRHRRGLNPVLTWMCREY